MSQTLGAGPDRGLTADAFAFEKYRLDRAHEVELNKATLQYENETLKILAYLNGGGAATYTGFLSSTLKQPQGVPSFLSLLAVVVWALGLFAAAIALWRAYEAQVLFAQAYHRRRRAEEKRRFSGADAYNHVTDPSRTAKDYDVEADKAVVEGRCGITSAKLAGLASLLMFCLGLAFALLSMAR